MNLDRTSLFQEKITRAVGKRIRGPRNHGDAYSFFQTGDPEACLEPQEGCPLQVQALSPLLKYKRKQKHRVIQAQDQKNVFQTGSKLPREAPRHICWHLPRPSAAAGGGAVKRVWELPERVSSHFETRISDRCSY